MARKRPYMETGASKQAVDSKERYVLADGDSYRDLQLTKEYYLSSLDHGGNIQKLSAYRGVDREVIRRAIYDGVGNDPPWEYSKFKVEETHKQQMRAITAEFHRFLEATNLPELKNVVRMGTDIIKRGLSELHSNPIPMTPKEIGQVASVVDTCYKIVRLVEEKPTDIVQTRNMTPDQVREGMEAMRAADKGVIDWDQDPEKAN